MKFDDDSIKHISFPTTAKILIIIMAITLVFTVLMPFLTTDHYKASLEQQASTYDKNDPDYNDERVLQSVRLIERTNNCEDLKKMFEENWAWFTRPMLADKILKTCFK